MEESNLLSNGSTNFEMPKRPKITKTRLIIGTIVTILLALAVTMTCLFLKLFLGTRPSANFSYLEEAVSVNITKFKENDQEAPFHFIYGYPIGKCPTCYCSYESALWNSERKLYIYIKADVEKFKAQDGWFDNLKTEFQNRITFFDITSSEELYKGTPFEGFETSALYNNSDNEMKPYHLADSARLAAVYKYGGIYLDSDQVMIRRGLDQWTYAYGYQNPPPSNIYNDGHAFGNAYFAFPRQDPYVWELMKDFIKGFDGTLKNYGHNGPNLFTRTALRCEKGWAPFDGSDVKLAISCSLMRYLPREKVIPVNWRYIEKEMTTDADSDAGKILLNRWFNQWESYILKIGGTKLMNKQSKLSESWIISKLMTGLCPLTKNTTMRDKFQ